jgi:amino acid adenylation domain-containing protein
VRTSELLEKLRGLQVRLWVEGAELGCSAPKGVLTPELRAALKEHKAEIVAMLSTKHGGTALPPVEPLPERDAIPLSFSQQRLWFLGQLEPDAPVYNMPLAWTLRGPLDVRALEQSLAEFVRRHEVLRTSFLRKDGVPVQVIGAPFEPRLEPVWRAEGATPVERRSHVRRELAQRAREPFDLERGPLCRPALLRISDEEHVLFLLVHHIVFDGWSASVFLRELARLYPAFAAGDAHAARALSEPLLQYADFAAWQRRHLEPSLEPHLAYWRGVLDGARAVLELPTDRPRPAMQSYRGANERRAVDAAFVQGLRELARREGVTFYMLLLAAYDVLLARISGQDDVLVGTVVANRSRPELDGLVGFFANTLVLRTDLSGDPTFRELLGRVKAVCLSAYEHQDVPFERLVEELHPERNLAYTPLFQTLFMIEDEAGRGASMGEVDLELLELEAEVARTDLMLTGHQDRDGYSIWVEYSTDLFDQATIAALLDHYVEILQSALKDSGARVSRMGMLPEAERRRLVEDWNATAMAFPEEALHQRFEGVARRQPGSIALVYPALSGGQDEEVSYAELEARSNRIARHLVKRGVQPGDLVGLCLDRSSGMVESVLGILKTGAAYVPLDPAFPRDRLSYMAEDAQLSLVVTRRELAGLVEGVERVLLDEEAQAIAAEASASLGIRVDPRARMYVIYTSGSTGRPKGVEIEHRSVSNFQTSMQREPGFVAGEKLLAVTTLSFDISVLEVMLPLVSGGTVIVAPKEAVGDGSKLIGLLERLRPEVMQATPATWRLLLLSGWKGSSTLRIFSGGEALPRDLAEELLGKGKEVWNLYGPTETTIWSTVKKVEPGTGAVRIGKPIGNTRVYVLDRNQELLPTGVPGELWIGGEGLARGYLNRPELTSERFVADPYSSEPGARMYRTGDMARWKRGAPGAPGELECLGRIDNQVKLRGFRIELGEIESVLTEVAGVRQCVCVVKDAGGGDQRLVAYWLREPGAQGQELEQALKEKAAERLPSYMCPSLYAELAEFPHTPNGKVDRKALSKLELSKGAAAEAAVAPETELETKIAKVWGEVLKLADVSVTRNFFDLGGHSLLLAEAHAKLRDAVDPSLSIIEMFQYPSVRSLASHIHSRRSDAPSEQAPERQASLAAGRKALMQRRKR